MTLTHAELTKEEAEQHAYDCVLGFAHEFESDNLDDDFVALHPDVKYDKDLCDGIIEKKMEQIYDGLTESYKEVLAYYNMPYDSCVVDKFKEEKYGHLYLLQFLYQHEKNATQLQRKQWEAQLSAILQVKRGFTWKVCHPLKAFESDFDYAYVNNLFDYTIYKKVGYEMSQNELEESYCIKYSVLESNFSGASTYSINANPKNIDVSKVDCDKILADERTELFKDFVVDITEGVKSSNEKQTFCVRKVVTESHYDDWFFLIWSIGEKQVDGVAKSDLKHNFVKFMEDLYKKAVECFA